MLNLENLFHWAANIWCSFVACVCENCKIPAHSHIFQVFSLAGDWYWLPLSLVTVRTAHCCLALLLLPADRWSWLTCTCCFSGHSQCAYLLPSIERSAIYIFYWCTKFIARFILLGAVFIHSTYTHTITLMLYLSTWGKRAESGPVPSPNSRPATILTHPFHITMNAPVDIVHFAFLFHSRHTPVTDDIPIDSWKYFSMFSHIHRTKFTSNWKFIFSIAGHCGFICGIACNDVCRS